MGARWSLDDTWCCSREGGWKGGEEGAWAKDHEGDRNIRWSRYKWRRSTIGHTRNSGGRLDGWEWSIGDGYLSSEGVWLKEEGSEKVKTDKETQQATHSTHTRSHTHDSISTLPSHYECGRGGWKWCFSLYWYHVLKCDRHSSNHGRASQPQCKEGSRKWIHHYSPTLMSH